MRTLVGRAAHCACLAACAISIGCVAGVVPLPTRTRGATGEEAKQHLRPDFIRPGHTSRAEVTEKLAWADAGLGADNFFLARWSKSNWGTFEAFLDPLTQSTSHPGGGAGQRHWEMYNALVEFDDQGVVKQSTVFGDSSLVKELSLIVVREKPADFSEPQKIWVDHYWHRTLHAATIILSKGNFEVQENGNKGHNFQIASKKVVSLESQTAGGNVDLQRMHELIHFAEKTEAGTQMSVRISVQDLLVLLKFLAQDQRSDLR
jgi:hypothetical protein